MILKHYRQVGCGVTGTYRQKITVVRNEKNGSMSIRADGLCKVTHPPVFTGGYLLKFLLPNYNRERIRNLKSF